MIAHDPIVHEAEQHAVKAIQERPNSLFPYELWEIIYENAEINF